VAVPWADDDVAGWARPQPPGTADSVAVASAAPGADGADGADGAGDLVQGDAVQGDLVRDEPARDVAAPEDPLAWHLLLLNLAGALPDGLLCRARSWLAAGDLTALARAVGFAAAVGRVPVTAAEAALLSGRLRAAGLDTDLIETLELIGDPALRPVYWAFTAQLEPGDPEGGGPDQSRLRGGPLDLSTGVGPSGDLVDEAIVAAAARIGMSAVWRSWRAPADGSPWPAARRVFVVQADPELSGTELVGATAWLQETLVAAGEPDPQVEVCGPGSTVPAYQSTACAHAALIWAAEDTRQVRLAAVFDAVDPDRGPMFDPAHPVIEDLDELTELLEHLNNGLPVLTTSATMTDIMDPDRRDVVPLTFRTDGVWVWNDATSYFLERYGLAPEPDLLEHLRGRQEHSPEVSDVTLHRILSHLQQADGGRPVRAVPWARA